MRSALVPLRSLAVLLAGFATGIAHADRRVFVSVDAAGMPQYTDTSAGKASAINHIDFKNPPFRKNSISAFASHHNFKLALIAPKADLVGRALIAAQANSVPAALLLAVMNAESNFNPAARSSAGAIGLMQIMPTTGSRYGVHTGLADPAVNIDVGARYLRDLLIRFGGDISLALAAYNAGEGAVSKYGGQIPPYVETQTYVPKVLNLFDLYLKSVPHTNAATM